MFEHILAAIDDDTIRRGRIIEATQQVAAALKARVVVAHVRELERASVGGRPTAVTSSVGERSVALEDEALARTIVDDAVRTLQGAGVQAAGVVRAGGAQTAKELLDLAQEYDADLIVVGDRGAHVTDLLLGNVAHRIVHGAPCPVLLIR